mgnify:CR=1 FL=1
MTKLKTLKDFSECMYREHKCCVPYFKEELKQEAIKWVKHLRKEPRRKSTDEQANILIEFFNITSEDLK